MTMNDNDEKDSLYVEIRDFLEEHPISELLAMVATVIECEKEVEREIKIDDPLAIKTLLYLTNSALPSALPLTELDRKSIEYLADRYRKSAKNGEENSDTFLTHLAKNPSKGA